MGVVDPDFQVRIIPSASLAEQTAPTFPRERASGALGSGSSFLGVATRHMARNDVGPT